MKIEEQSSDSYKPSFDTEYNKKNYPLPSLPTSIKNLDDSKSWVDAFSRLKEIMDFYFANNSKPEREFQQLVARENNFSTISNESEYFISDIEFADSNLGARFDMLAIRWLASQRKNGSNCRPALVEMKYGDNALGGKAGLIKHLQDFASFISDSERYSKLLSTMEAQFNQLDELELLHFNRSTKGTTVKLDADEKPEVILIMANHNPRSSKLATILNDPDVRQFEHSANFDLKFYVSSFAGYALHADNMVTLSQFLDLLKQR